MASSSSGSATNPRSGGGGGGISAKQTTDPILRNTLRYTISAREYALLHRYVLSRSRQLKKRVPTVETVNRIINNNNNNNNGSSSSSSGGGGAKKSSISSKEKGKEEWTVRDVGSTSAGLKAGAGAMLVADDYNARAVRHSLRALVLTAAGMKGYALIAERLMGAKKDPNFKKQPFYKGPAFRLSLSLSTILLLYRLLFRFFTRLRAALLEPNVEPFRVRNPTISRALTSPYTPAVGASIAGFALAGYPAEQLRVTIAIYASFRALEFGWNYVEDAGLVWGRGRDGKLKKRPWWFGSWMMQPLAFGQLLHAFVFDQECFPKGYDNFILKNSSAYIHPRPEGYPPSLQWPQTREVVDSLGQMAKLNWPPHISPILFPNKEEVLPPSLKHIAPLTDPAHPLITKLSCALLHPSDPSCTRTLLTFWIRSFPPLARFFLLVYSAFTIPRFRKLYHNPVSTLHRLVLRALSMSAFVTGSISTAWASICFFQNWLPRSVLPTQRFFLGGFFAGFWAWIERKQGRGVFLYSARASVDSLWKVGVKRRWWKAMKAGDVWVFVLAVMVTGVVYERDKECVREEAWRKGISWMRGQGFRDWALEEDDEEEEEEDGGDASVGEKTFRGEGSSVSIARDN